MSKKFGRIKDTSKLPKKAGHHYKIRKSIQWFDDYDNSNIRITTSKGDMIELGLRTVNYPHLMGLQYTTDKRLSAHQMIGIGLRKSDEDIARLVSVCDKENPVMIMKRARSVKPFLQNLENVALVEYNPSTNGKSTMKFSKALVIRKDKNVQMLGLGTKDNGELFLNTFLPDRHLGQMKGVNFKNTVEKIEIYEREFNNWREFSFDREKDKDLYNKFIETEFNSDIEAVIDDMVFIDELTVERNGSLVMSDELINKIEKYIDKNSLASNDLKEGLAAMLFEDINDYGKFSGNISTFDVLEKLEEHCVEVPEKNINKNLDIDL